MADSAAFGTGTATSHQDRFCKQCGLRTQNVAHLLPYEQMRYEEFYRLAYNAVQSVISQKIAVLFITTAVRTSNPTQMH
jgi:hypothetical protein